MLLVYLFIFKQHLILIKNELKAGTSFFLAYVCCSIVLLLLEIKLGLFISATAILIGFIFTTSNRKRFQMLLFCLERCFLYNLIWGQLKIVNPSPLSFIFRRLFIFL